MGDDSAQIVIASPSAMSLLLEMRFNGMPLATGAGFVVGSASGPVLITARHNLTGKRPDTQQAISRHGGVPNEVLIAHNRAGQLGDWVQREEKLYQDDVPRWTEHPALGDKADIGALPLTELEQVELYTYDLTVAPAGPQITVGPAEVVSVIGFPFGLTASGSLGIWATGFIASELALDFDDLPAFLIDCRSRQGQSGSPVIAYRAAGITGLDSQKLYVTQAPSWRCLGMYSGRINRESDLGLVWKASAIAELVQAADNG